ncbi:MAG: hypothetical protein IJ882_06885 [Paludibacteraceae bacterium]|nr:hypothetical protein [Paludibacteraceae bacterium]
MNKKERLRIAKQASYRYIREQLRVISGMVSALEEANRVLSMENDKLSAQARAQEPAQETETPPSPESHLLYDPQPVQTLRYWIIKSRHDKEYFYLRSKENLVIEPSWINDKLCVSGVTHATLVPEYLGLQMQIEYNGDFNLDFDVTIVENSIEEDETHVFFFYPLSVVGSDKSPEEMGARWSSMVKNFDRYGNANYRYREWGIVDGRKKVVFERVFPVVHAMRGNALCLENIPTKEA